MEESGDDEPPNQISKKRNFAQFQKQIMWMETGTVWTTSTDFTDYDEKLMLDGTLTRFSSPIELFKLFFHRWARGTYFYSRLNCSTNEDI